MRSEPHILIASILLMVLSIYFFLYFEPFPIYFDLIGGLPIFMAGMGLFWIGAILPDSDSENLGSKIFYTPFFPIALYFRLLDRLISKITQRPRGHRESLHTIVGIALTSFFTIVLFSIIWVFLLTLEITAWGFLFLFICLFSAQFLHLLEDFHLKLI